MNMTMSGTVPPTIKLTSFGIDHQIEFIRSERFPSLLVCMLFFTENYKICLQCLAPVPAAHDRGTLQSLFQITISELPNNITIIINKHAWDSTMLYKPIRFLHGLANLEI